MSRNPTVTFQDGTTHTYNNVPDSVTPDAVQDRAEKEFGKAVVHLDGGRMFGAPSMENLKSNLGNLGAGALRGAGSIGSTLMTPYDLLVGNTESIGNPERRKAIDEGLKSMGANPESGMYKTGKIAAEIAGTLPVGGVIGQGAKALGYGKIGQAIGSAGFDVGPAAATIGGKLGNALLRVGGGAVTGGAAAGLINPKDASAGSAIGAGFGALSPVIGKIANPIINKLSKTPSSQITANSIQATDSALSKVADDLGIAVDDIPASTQNYLKEEIFKALKSNKSIDAATLLRNQDFQALGIKPLQGQITRDPTQFAMERNIRGVAPQIQQVLTEQNAALQNIIGKPSQGALEKFNAGEDIIGTLKAQDEQARAGVSALYKQARASAGKDLEIPITGLADDYMRTLDNFGDKVPSGVRNQFKKFGLEGSNQTKLFTIEESDKLLKVINDHVGSDMATNKALGELRNAVKQSILNIDASGGVYAPAVKAAQKRFTQLDANPALKAVAEGGAIPDDFVNKYLIRGKTNDVKALAEALKQSPDNFNQAKLQIANDIKQAAFGENITRDSALRPEALAKKLRELGTEKLSAFFSPDELARYQTAMRVASYIEKHPNAAPVNTSNTLVAQLMTNPMVQLAGKTVGATVEALPGGGIVTGMAKAGTGAVKNAMAASQAMNTKIPTQNLGLNEQQRRLLAKALGRTGSATSVTLVNE
jgi:hypothetical protein